MSAVIRMPAARRRLRHFADHRIELVPIHASGGLQVIDLRGGARCLGNVDGFPDRFDQAICLASDVGDIQRRSVPIRPLCWR